MNGSFARNYCVVLYHGISGGQVSAVQGISRSQLTRSEDMSPARLGQIREPFIFKVILNGLRRSEIKMEIDLIHELIEHC